MLIVDRLSRKQHGIRLCFGTMLDFAIRGSESLPLEKAKKQKCSHDAQRSFLRFVELSRYAANTLQHRAAYGIRSYIWPQHCFPN